MKPGSRTGVFLVSFVLLASGLRASGGGVVSNCDEPSLRAAMTGGGLVTFACDGTITLAAPLVISASTSIDASGHQVALSGGQLVRIFEVGSASLSLTNLTLADGAGLSAGAIVNSGTVTAVNCTFSGNSMTNTLGAGAGAILNMGAFVGIGCTFVSNHIAGAGAASAISINSSFSSTASLTLVNCTFFGNFVGSGQNNTIAQLGNQPSLILNCTIVGTVNFSTGPPTQPGSMTLRNTIATSCPGVIDGGNNICSDSSGSFTNQFSLMNTDPRLGPLANNGGPTLTMALLPDSPAIDRANPAFAPATDQRGFIRPYSIAPDVGAFETVLIGTNHGLLRFTPTNINALNNSGGAAITVFRDNGASGSVSVAFATSNGTAIAGQDYTATNGTLSFASGEITKSFVVPIAFNPLQDSAKTVQLTLSNPTGDASIATPSAILNILPLLRTLTTNDEASLRSEVGKGGVVMLAFDGTVTLTSPLLVTNSVKLNGSGHNVTLSGANITRMFNVKPGSALALDSLILANGIAPVTNGFPGPVGNPGGSGYGGAILNDHGTVQALNCSFTNNTALGGTGGDSTGTGFSAGSGGEGFGGVIYLDHGSFAATNCNFISNKAIGGTGGGGSLALSTGGNAAGGAIYNLQGTVELFNCVASSNSASGGSGRRFNATGASFGGTAAAGALYNSTGEVYIARSHLSLNRDVSGETISSFGGAIYQNGGTLSVVESFVDNNSVTGGKQIFDATGHPFNGAHAYGGAVYVAAGALFLSNSTLAGNLALGGAIASGNTPAGIGYGGAVYNLSTVQAANSTLSGNTAQGGAVQIPSSLVPGPSSGFGGGLFNSGGSLALDYVTLAGNQAAIGDGGQFTNSLAQGGAIFSTNGTATVHCVVLANSPSGSNCFGMLVDNGHNLSSDNSCNFNAPGSLNNSDPKLGPLANYGGPTPTMALLSGSSAIDAGDNVSCLPTDQRGRARPYGSACDIGAFESSAPFLVRGIVSGFTLKGEVLVTNGATSATTLGGAYSLEGLAAGSYTLTAVHSNYLFLPASQLIAVGPDQLDVNFKAYRWNTLSLEGISNNALVMILAGTNGLSYRLQTSSNLIFWNTVSTTQMGESRYLTFSEPLSASTHFYRTVTP